MKKISFIFAALSLVFLGEAQVSAQESTCVENAAYFGRTFMFMRGGNTHTVLVPDEAGEFSAVQLKAYRGNFGLTQITVTYENGGSDTMNFERFDIYKNHCSVIELPRASVVKSVTVTGYTTRYRTSYARIGVFGVR